MAGTANEIAISFEVGDIAHAVSGIDNLAASMARLGQASGSALQPIHNPFDALLTGLTALPGVAGKAALAVKTLSTAIEGAFNLLGEAAQRQMDFGVARHALASSPGTTAVVEGLGRAVGVDASSLAHQMRESAFNNPWAMQAASRVGYPMTPPGLPMDEGQAFLDAIRGLRDLYKTNQAEASNLAKNWNPAILKFLAIPDDAFSAFERMQRGRVGPYVNEQEGAAAATALRRQMFKDATLDAFLGGPGGGTGMGTSALPGFMGGGAGGAAQQRIQQQHEALKENSQKLQENTEQLSKLNGIYGGGPRARSAIPRSFQGRGDQLDAELQAGKAKFGAYAVGF